MCINFLENLERPTSWTFLTCSHSTVGDIQIIMHLSIYSISIYLYYIYIYISIYISFYLSIQYTCECALFPGNPQRPTSRTSLTCSHSARLQLETSQETQIHSYIQMTIHRQTRYFIDGQVFHRKTRYLNDRHDSSKTDKIFHRQIRYIIDKIFNRQTIYFIDR